MSSSQRIYALGVIGYPLGHSFSPSLHGAALHSCGLTGDYRLYPILPLPAGKDSLGALIGTFKEGRLDGLNVTIPHKQNVIAYLDELTPLAMQIGAVNTIFRRGRSLIGDNTDAPGFMADLQKQFSQAVSPQSALVLGGGGSARAVVYALLAAGWQVTVAARRPAAAQEIIDSYSFSHPSCEVIALYSLPDFIGNLDNLRWEQHPKRASSPSVAHRSLTLLVNTTPVGMAPDITQSPWPKDLPFPGQAFVYDLFYKPIDTTLVRAARDAGLAAASGLGMLIEQAALAFERWMGIRPSLDAMRQGVMEMSKFPQDSDFGIVKR